MSSPHICCSECQDFVSNDEETNSQASQKFISDTKGLRICFKRMLCRRERPNPNSLTSYDMAALESIKKWETTNGKRALLCAVTYNKQKYKLKGTNNDVNSMQELLISRFHFPRSSIRILAGHGLRQPDFFDDEIDGFDESICPLDFRTAGMIVDNEINETIVRPLKTGVKLHAIIDACHSGTILDLSCVYSTKESRWLDNSAPSGAYKGTSGGHAISISACEDNQLAADTSAFSESGKQMEGAMTFTFKKALAENSRVTYSNLLASMHNDILEAKAKCFSLRGLFHRERLQEPLLSSSKVFDVNEPFVL
ncbi:hypothetical protein Tco_1345471 [Tanacetum coccineum]